MELESGISVAAICKDSDFCAEKIGKAFASLAAGVDEFILVRTGADDGSGKLVDRSGDPVVEGDLMNSPDWLKECCGDTHVVVYGSPWCWDFSHTRNFGLDRCVYDWLFIIDADEILDGDSALTLRELTGLNDEAVAYFIQEHMYRLGKKVSTVSTLRLFRNQPTMRYKGFIHNQLQFNGIAGNVDIVMHHYGGESEDHAARVIRNEKFRDRIKERLDVNPDDYENFYNLIKTYSYDMEHKRVIEWGNKLIEKMYPEHRENPTREEKELLQSYHRVYYMVGLAEMLYGNHRAAFDMCAYGARFIESADLFFVAANAAYMSGDFPNAYLFFRRYLHRLPVEQSGQEHAVSATETFLEYVRDKYAVLIQIKIKGGVEPFMERSA